MSPPAALRAWLCSEAGLLLVPAASQAAALRPVVAAGGSLHIACPAPAPVCRHTAVGSAAACLALACIVGPLYLADLPMHGLPSLPLCRASASSSTRAAPQDEAATQALTRLQQAGVPKVAAAPQAAHSAAFQPDWHLDAPAAVEQRSAFSPDMLVKA